MRFSARYRDRCRGAGRVRCASRAAPPAGSLLCHIAEFMNRLCVSGALVALGYNEYGEKADLPAGYPAQIAEDFIGPRGAMRGNDDLLGSKPLLAEQGLDGWHDMRRSLLGAAIGGGFGGALNGLLLWAGIPRQLLGTVKPGIVAAGLWHGLALAVSVRLTLLVARNHRILLPVAGYLGGVLGGMLGVLVLCLGCGGFELYGSVLTTWEGGWQDWGFVLGGPVGLAFGLVACFGPARSRLALLARNVCLCQTLCAIAASGFWCWSLLGHAWQTNFGEYLPTALVHGSVFGTLYASCAIVMNEREPVLLSERVLPCADSCSGLQ